MRHGWVRKAELCATLEADHVHSPNSMEFQRYWTGERIDRSFAANSQRLMIGLAVTPDWSRVDGCLAVATGRGKYLRLRHVVDDSEPVPDGLAGLLPGKNPAPAMKEVPAGLRFAGRDLATCQATLVARLSAAAGKYVDRILAVAVNDPGHWLVDFDGARTFQPVGDAERLSELTGLSVIDGFPARDLGAGGNGTWLNALPCWFLFADRRDRRAAANSLLLMAGDRIEWLFLPGSDGLDESFPDIRAGEVDALDLRAAISGADCIRAALPVVPETGQAAGVSAVFIAGNGPSRPAADKIANVFGLTPSSGPDLPDEAFLETGQLNARVAGLLGLMFADQFPQSVPTLTGASGPRLLGRLVPGRPFSFSNLVASIADSQVSTMRLRDAV